MRRLLPFLIGLAVLITAAVWLADNPGSVTIHWLGWRVDTGVPVFLIGVLGCLAIVLGVLRLLRGLLGIGRAIGSRLEQRRVNSGLLALTKGFAAVQAGDVRTAARLAGTAAGKLRQEAATRLLTAEAARLGGDLTAAREGYERLLGEAGMELAALRGLSQIADAEGQGEAALQWARRALEAEPALGWARQRVLSGLLAARQWDDAVQALTAARKAGLLAGPEADRQCAEALTAQGRETLTNGQAAAAVKLARKALEHDPRHRPAAVLLVQALAADGAVRKAADAAITAWRTMPHPDLAAAYMALHAQDDALKQVAVADRLAEANPEHAESRLLVARLSLQAKLWGQARARLKPLVEAAQPDPRACVLMAEVEDSETHDSVASLRWMRRAVTAP